MLDISAKEFGDIVDEVIRNVPKPYSDRLDNIAFLVEDEPSEMQRIKQQLGPHQTLLGLYEGVPLPARNGATKLLPDKITIFKNPLLAVSSNLDELKNNVGRTVWHEVAHYFGLDHARIHELENRIKS